MRAEYSRERSSRPPARAATRWR